MNPLFLLKLVSPQIWAGLALAAALALSAWWLHHSGVVTGRAEVQMILDAEHAAIARDSLRVIEASGRKSTDLQIKADTAGRALHAANISIELARDESLKRLRGRPQRPTESDGGVPPDPGSSGSGLGATGAGLSEQDAEFLVREAARANQLRAALIDAYQRYREAQSSINTE